MAKKIEKTNAARLLDKAGISYDLIPYEFDENDLAAQHVADSLGQPIERVFKTLVLHGDRSGHLVCVIPGNGEVDLKALAKVSGNKKVEMIAMKDLLAVTGYLYYLNLYSFEMPSLLYSSRFLGYLYYLNLYILKMLHDLYKLHYLVCLLSQNLYN